MFTATAANIQPLSRTAPTRQDRSAGPLLRIDTLDSWLISPAGTASYCWICYTNVDESAPGHSS